ncbi:uncharacterized protein LACBIDRAFT_303869 [Laccaria bicolor S238N-H82]|uniref:Predicted protein n=1 Tax=Laccaria bicolor (strain S238N-H82 / ATCC MYA-4686) TaxID=486041 RepID=B0DKJ3_LACBS|nr:uncharacterized protein LACBIDRAFT_303869 [Laccaria bicolor S238N-H82]EDR05078.1 predicted protein [Laccaria bicolor S238N-H82]|eukprot:XP_001884468.1 predicted protein [Laccaria bicolor S238N-H82]
MGIPGIWNILLKAKQSRPFTELTVLEGFEANRRGARTLMIGVDASIWLNQTQSIFHVPGMHYQAGENPELRTLFYRLARFRKLPIHLVFVFDGEHRPSIKRGVNVCTKAHALTSSFQEFIEQYGYSFHTAPAEAEAELAVLNSHGIIDAVLSDDADTLLFGATHLIRNPNVKEDGDNINIYTADAICSTLSLTSGGILLLAILSGGDYDPGCGMTTAYSLARAGFGDELLHATKTCPPPELEQSLEKWRNRLRMALRYNDAGHLSRRQVALSNSVPNTFPDPRILALYVNPITSWSPGQKLPNTAAWVPREVNLTKLAALCERSFTWGTSDGILSCFQEHVWPGMTLYRLVEEANVDPTAMLTAHFAQTIAEGTFALSSILCIVRQQKAEKKAVPGYTVEVQTGHLSTATLSGLRGLRTFTEATTKSATKKTKILPGRMMVWVPCSILEQALPALVARYQKAQKSKNKPSLAVSSTYKAIFPKLFPTAAIAGHDTAPVAGPSTDHRVGPIAVHGGASTAAVARGIMAPISGLNVCPLLGIALRSLLSIMPHLVAH